MYLRGSVQGNVPVYCQVMNRWTVRISFSKSSMCVLCLQLCKVLRNDYACNCRNCNQILVFHRCKTYTSLPSVCKMYDVPGECCAEVRCKTPESSPTPPVIGGPTVRPYLDPLCHDTIDNCKNYQKEVACRGAYEPWARSHCNLTCGFCSKDYSCT